MSNTVRLRVIADEHHGDYVDIGEPQIRVLVAMMKRMGLLEPTPVTVRLHSVKTGETVATSDPVEAAADALVNAMIYGKSTKVQDRAEAAARAALEGLIEVKKTTETTLHAAAGLSRSVPFELQVFHALTGEPVAKFFGADCWSDFLGWHAFWSRTHGVIRAPYIDVACGLVRV